MRYAIAIAIAASMCLCVFAAPTKSSVAARHLVKCDGTGTATAADYVQDGLVAMWDGIENAGWGQHADNPDVFVDLVGSDSIGKYGSSVSSVYPTWFSANALCARPYRNASLSTGLYDSLIGGDVTVELAATRESTGSTVGLPAIAGGNWLAFSGFIGLRLLLYNRGAAQYVDGFPNVGPYSFAVTLAVDGNGVMTIYKNGTFYANVNPGTMSPPSNGGWYIGQNLNLVNNSNYFALLTHSVRIYGRTLTAAEVAANYAVDKERFGLP